MQSVEKMHSIDQNKKKGICTLFFNVLVLVTKVDRLFFFSFFFESMNVSDLFTISIINAAFLMLVFLYFCMCKLDLIFHWVRV